MTDPVAPPILVPGPNPYYLPDYQHYEVLQERQRRDEALYLNGEYAAFVLMWTIFDFDAKRVARCSLCYEAFEPIANAFHQPAKENCPDCFGTSFEGGVKALLIRPSMWRFTETVEERDARGIAKQAQGTVQSTSEFLMQKFDYVFRQDGTRWQVQTVDADHLFSGFTRPESQDTHVSAVYGLVRENESSVAHIIPPTPAVLLPRLNAVYPRTPQDFTDIEIVRGPVTPYD